MPRHTLSRSPPVASPPGLGEDEATSHAHDAPALSVLLVAHGYPPRENAGTEQHTAALAAGLARRGHRVTVIAATRDPTAAQYQHIVERGRAGEVVHRIVQNMPTRPLAQAERDPAIESVVNRVVAKTRPDLVHIHHLQFLSSSLRFAVPSVLSLHDQWLWCAAGGLGLLPDGRTCPGPRPVRCAPCAAAWAPRPRGSATLALRAAGLASLLVPPHHLHSAARALPESLRRWLQQPQRGAPPEAPAAAVARNDAFRELAARACMRLAPSQHLADLAEAAGIGQVSVLRHGLDAPALRPLPTERTGPLLFLGTIAAHKGPDLVVRAWRRAFPAGEPGLALHGPVQDPALALGHPVGPRLDRVGVAAALAGARALVLGSIWPENAPLVVIEARAAGCPVIAPACGGLPELVKPGRDGWLYPTGDEAALAEAMQCAITQPLAALPALPPTAGAMLDRLIECYRHVLEAA